MEKVTHLHFHSEYSLRDSIIKIDILPKLIKKKNVKAIALTDHGNVDGAIKFYQKTKDVKLEDGTGFVPLLGCEFYVVDDYTQKIDRKRYHLTVIAKNLVGFQSIMKTLTVANLEGFYWKPRISWDYILDNLDNVVVMTACTDGVLRHPNATDLLCRLHEKYGKDFYLEAMLLTDFEPYKRQNIYIKELSEAMNIKIAFANDVHYPDKCDWSARDVCFAIAYNKQLDPERYEESVKGQTEEMYLKDYDEMVESLNCEKFPFRNYKDHMIEVWDEIVGKCKCDWLEQMKVMVPVAYEKAEANPKEYLKEMCREKFEQKRQREEFKDEEQALQRMEHELKEICDGEVCFAEYFLLVADMVKEVKKKDIMVGVGRGSAGASIVSWLLDITGVNPLDYDLMFERFISPGRHDLPDIDLDFEDVRRGEVIKYLRDKYGENNVALVSTYMTMKGRGALRDVSRAFNVPLGEVGAAAKQILVRSGGDARASFSIEDTMSLFEVAKEFKKRHPKVVKEAEKLEGLMKNKGIHAAGVVVDTEDLHEGTKCVLVRGKQGQDEVVVNWDKKDLEYMGLMKIDVLGLKTLNVLHIIKNLVEERKGEEIKWEEHIPLEDEGDPKLIEKFQKGETVGVFQLGTPGVIQYIKNFIPKNFRELYQVSSLFRPGTLRSGMASEFIRVKEHPDEIKYINEELKEILKETHGIVLFQEQIMYILNRLGNVPWRNADVIRKVVSKSEGQEKFESFRQEFLKGAKELGKINQADANKIFDLMRYFGSYGFNKTHAVEYTILGYWTMWAKVYYPLEFYCALLMREGDKDAISALINDVDKRADMKIALPDVHKSNLTWTIEGENILRAGFDIIKGISSHLSQTLIEVRDQVGGEWKDFEHFYDTVPRRVVNIARVKSLLLANVFGNWFTEEERKKMIVCIEKNKKVPIKLKELEEIGVEEFDELGINEQEIYNYELAQEFLNQNKNLVSLIRNKYDEIMELKDVEGDKILGEKWFMGKFDEIKYGYRAAVSKVGGTDATKGYADDLGGVYGIFRDASGHNYATFTKDLYRREGYKGRIEDIAGKYLLLKADKPTEATNLFVKEVYFLDDIKKGDFVEGLDLSNTIREYKEDYGDLREAIRDCSGCEAKKYCKGSVPLSCGLFDVMIVGQDPGPNEEIEGEPFVGRAGKLLWETLGEVSGYLARNWFYISNVRKCRPGGAEKDSKIRNVTFDKTCTNLWLKLELELIKPRLILSLGSVAGKYLSRREKFGIEQLSGSVEWNETMKAWIVYAIHPAAFLHRGGCESADFKRWKKEALGKFCHMFERLI